MTRKEDRWIEDPVVEDVRAVRAIRWREGGGTVAGLLRAIEKRKGPTRRITFLKRATQSRKLR